MDLKPAPEIVSQRLKSQFTPAYLTLTSIIQGVALLAIIAIIVFLGSSVPFWSQVLAYSRGEYKARQPRSAL